MPAINGPCPDFVSKLNSCFVTDLICNIANPNNPMAPNIVIIVLISGILSIEKNPTPNNNIKGNSTMVCPIAIFIPEILPSRNPYITFAANNGPGDITPDAEITMTNPKKPNISCMLN